jgi:hypothetical protein
MLIFLDILSWYGFLIHQGLENEISDCDRTILGKVEFQIS